MASGARLNEVERGAWVGFLRAHHVLVGELDEELRREHGLPLTSFDVLVQLDMAPDGQLRMSELADAVLLSRSGLTRLVDRLESQGLLRRERCASDARGLFAEITDDGRAVFAEARRTHLDGVRRLFLEHFSRDELRQIASLWERVGV